MVKTVARLLAFLSVAVSSLLYVRIGHPINPLRGILWILRVLAEAVTPFIALGGGRGSRTRPAGAGACGYAHCNARRRGGSP